MLYYTPPDDGRSLQPLSYRGLSSFAQMKLERDGWKQVDRDEYEEALAEWRRAQGRDPGPLPAA